MEVLYDLLPQFGVEKGFFLLALVICLKEIRRLYQVQLDEKEQRNLEMEQTLKLLKAQVKNGK